jgi:Ca2+-binding EF-hand superfamily protein
MLRNFREFDPSSIGVVDCEDFRQVLRNFNVNLTEDEFSHLIGRHGNQGNCLLSYNDFIKEFLKNT